MIELAQLIGGEKLGHGTAALALEDAHELRPVQLFRPAHEEVDVVRHDDISVERRLCSLALARDRRDHCVFGFIAAEGVDEVEHGRRDEESGAGLLSIAIVAIARHACSVSCRKASGRAVRPLLSAGDDLRDLRHT